MYSGAIAATIGRHERGVATVTRPAPDRSAPIAARCAAPVRPIEPAMTSTRPKSPLCESAARGRHELAHPLAREQLEVRPLDVVDHRHRNADVGDHEVAACESAGGSTSGIFGAASVTVIDASIASPSTSCESADTPVGRSIATTGTPEAVDVRHDGLEQPAQRDRGIPCRGSRPRSVALGDLAEVQLPFLRVRDLDDGQADAAQDLEVGSRVAAHVRDAAEQEHRTFRCRAARACARRRTRRRRCCRGRTARRRGSTADPRTRPPSPPPPGARRSPSARPTGCRCRRSCGDRPRASAAVLSTASKASVLLVLDFLQREAHGVDG